MPIGRWKEIKARTINVCGEELVSRKDLAESYAKIVDQGATTRGGRKRTRRLFLDKAGDSKCGFDILIWAAGQEHKPQ